MAISPVSGEKIQPKTEEIVCQLAKIYGMMKLNKSLCSNIAVTLGRLSLINPIAVASYLDKISK